MTPIRVVCYCDLGDRCPRCRGYGAINLTGWRRRIVRWIVGLPSDGETLVRAVLDATARKETK